MSHRIQGFVLDHLTGERLNRDSKGMFVPALYSNPKMPVHSINQSLFDDFVDEMRDVYASGTFRVFLSRIRTMMVWVADCGYAVPIIDWKKHSR